DIEDQRGAAGDRRRVALVAVREVGGARQYGLLADLHPANTLGPALDDAVQRKRRGLVALARAVEHGAVGQAALVVHLPPVRGRRRGAVPRPGGPDAHPRRGLDRARLARRRLDDALRALLFLLRRGHRARARQRVDLRAVGVRIDRRLPLL